MRYRKRPVEVQAVKILNVEYDETNGRFKSMPFDEWNPWLDKALNLTKEIVYNHETREWYIKTLEDGVYGKVKHVASIGDYIIKGVKGELYPCKPDIFEMKYEEVE